MAKVRNEKLSGVEKRRMELEKWRKDRQEAKELIKKMYKPPFKPVGKSSLFDPDKNYFNSSLHKSLVNKRNTRLTSTQVSHNFAAKFSSTPYVVSKKDKVVKGESTLKINRNSESSRETFGIRRTKNEVPEKYGTSCLKRKGVQFKENLEEIQTFSSQPTEKQQQTPPRVAECDTQSEEEIRRRSFAGNTPYSCTSSRSGSTPGRKDRHSGLVSRDPDNFQTPKSTAADSHLSTTPRSFHRRSRVDSLNHHPRWYVPLDSIMKRDPYMLRTRTPSILYSNSKNTSKKMSSRTPRKSVVNDENKKRKLQVSFGAVTVRETDREKTDCELSPLDDTFTEFAEARGASDASKRGSCGLPTPKPYKFYGSRSPTFD